MEKRYYIAYGSNLNIPQMRMRCPGARIIGTSLVEGYRLLFKGSRTGSYLTIEPQEGASVPVAAWAVTEEDEAALDRYEGFPTFYYKKEMELPLKGIKTGKVRLRKVFVYIMHEDRPLGLPSESYMETCRQGYRSFGFDEAFLEQAYADSREEFPGGWKTGDACFMVTNRKNGCTGNYTVLGFDGRYFTLQNSRGSRYRASAAGRRRSPIGRKIRNQEETTMKETDNITRISVCPRCGQTYHGRPAVSRADNKTQICPDCGTREALESIGVDGDEQEQILEAIHRCYERHGQN